MSTTSARPPAWRTRLGWLLLSIGIVVALPGCASGGDRAAAAQLARLQESVYNEASIDFRRGFDPVVLARWATNDSGPYELGDGQQFDRRVEALSWTSEDGMDGVVDLRLTVTTPGYQSNSFGQSSYGPGSAQRCVRFHVGAAADSATRIDCGDRPAVAVPPPAPEPAALDTSALRRAMKASSLAAAEAAARTAYPGLSVTAEEVGGWWVVVVIRERPEVTCLGGTRSLQGKVQVTTVSRVRPGENDCGAVSFVRGPA